MGGPPRKTRSPLPRESTPSNGRGATRENARPRRDAAAGRAPSPAVLLERLTALYPDSKCSLDFETPFQLLVATILSAQCTDVRVNVVTPALFARYPSPAALAAARQEEVEELVKSTGFFRNKAKSIIGMATALVERHGGEVPGTIEELTQLPGVGRKTANVILGNAYGRNDGVVVDTHVARLSGRLGLSRQSDPVKIESELMVIFPRERWTALSHLLIDHGRAVCDARAPRCPLCTLADLCPSAALPA